MICNVIKLVLAKCANHFCAFSTVVEKIVEIIVNIIFGF